MAIARFERRKAQGFFDSEMDQFRLSGHAIPGLRPDLRALAESTHNGGRNSTKLCKSHCFSSTNEKGPCNAEPFRIDLTNQL